MKQRIYESKNRIYFMCADRNCVMNSLAPDLACFAWFVSAAASADRLLPHTRLL